MAKSGINIEVPKFQLNKLNKDLKQYAKRKDNQIATEIKATLGDILADAQSSAARASTNLATSGHIKFFKDKLMGLVWFKSLYAPFVEFGTGLNAFKGTSFRFTTEMKTYASQFWTRKKHTGIKARPYLFPAFVENTKELSKKIQKLLSKK